MNVDNQRSLVSVSDGLFAVASSTERTTQPKKTIILSILSIGDSSKNDQAIASRKRTYVVYTITGNATPGVRLSWWIYSSHSIAEYSIARLIIDPTVIHSWVMIDEEGNGGSASSVIKL